MSKFYIQHRFTDDPSSPEGDFDFWLSIGIDYKFFSEALAAVSNYQKRFKNTAVDPVHFRIIEAVEKITPITYEIGL